MAERETAAHPDDPKAKAEALAARLHSLRAISQALGRPHLDPRARCAVVAEQLRRVLPVDGCRVAVLDPRGDRLHLIYPAGGETSSDLDEPSAGGLDPEAQGYALRTCRPLRLNAPHSELHAPLLDDERHAFGLLSIHAEAPGAYDAEDEEFLALVAGHLAAAFSLAQLARQAERHDEDLHTLHAATVAMTSGRNPGVVLGTVAHYLITALGVQGAQILQCEPAPATGLGDWRLRVLLDIASTPTLHCLELGTVVEPEAYPAAARVIATRTPAVVCQGDPQVDPAERARLKAEGVRAALIVPLIARGEVIGVVVLRESRWERVFPAGDIRLVQMLATQAAIATENARAYQQSAQLVAELAALRETALDLASQLDLDQVVERVVDRSRHWLDARGGVLYLAEAGGGLRAAISRVPWADYAGQQVLPGEGLAGRVAQAGQPLLVNDYPRWSGRAAAPLAADEPIAAAAGVPLRWGEQVLGVLTILDDRPEHTFAPEDLDLLVQLAPQASLSIRNAQLYQESRRHVADLERAQAALVQSEKLAALGRLVASIAHEVNNPLQGIENSLHLCLQPKVSEEKRRAYLTLAQSEVERLIEIVQRLLDFYRPSREGRTVAQINSVLQDVLALADKQLERAGVTVRSELDPRLPPIEAVPGQLKQVFLNLMLNAMEAMPAGGELRIATRVDGGRWVVVELTDTGPGIPATDLPNIFEPFFTSKPHGSGLGLSVSYGIVQAHAGRIDVRSEVGRGTVFAVRLPIGSPGDANAGGD